MPERGRWDAAFAAAVPGARGGGLCASAFVGARLRGSSEDAGGRGEVANATAGWTSRGWRDAAFAAAAARRAGWWVLRQRLCGGAPSRQLRMETGCPLPPAEGARAGGSRLRSASGVKLRGRGEIEMGGWPGNGWARRRTGGRQFTAAGSGAATRPCGLRSLEGPEGDGWGGVIEVNPAGWRSGLRRHGFSGQRSQSAGPCLMGGAGRALCS